MSDLNSKLTQLERATASLNRTVVQLKQAGLGPAPEPDTVCVPRSVLLDLQSKFQQAKAEVIQMDAQIKQQTALIQQLKKSQSGGGGNERNNASIKAFRDRVQKYLTNIRSEVMKLSQENARLKAGQRDGSGSSASNSKSELVLKQVRTHLTDLRRTLLMKEKKFNEEKSQIRGKMVAVRNEILESEKEKRRMESQIQALMTANESFKTGTHLPPRLASILQDKLRVLREELLRIETENIQLRINQSGLDSSESPFFQSQVSTKLRLTVSRWSCNDCTVSIIDSSNFARPVQGESIADKARSFASDEFEDIRHLVCNSNESAAAALVFVDGLGTEAQISVVSFGQNSDQQWSNVLPCVARYCVNRKLDSSSPSFSSASSSEGSTVLINTVIGVQKVSVSPDNHSNVQLSLPKVNLIVVSEDANTIVEIGCDSSDSDNVCTFSIVPVEENLLLTDLADLLKLAGSDATCACDYILFASMNDENSLLSTVCFNTESQSFQYGLNESQLLSLLTAKVLSDGTQYRWTSKLGSECDKLSVSKTDGDQAKIEFVCWPTISEECSLINENSSQSGIL